MKPTLNKRGGNSQDDDAGELIFKDDTTSYVKVDEIWDANTSTFNRNTLSKLYKYITGNENAGVDTTTLNKITEMAEEKTTSADIRANVVDGKTSSQDIIVRFGGLDWQVVYLSQNDSGDNVLTLWLSSSYQEAWTSRSATEGDYYGFIDGSLYSDWSSDWESQWDGSYPSNLYSTSYIRAVTLNNGGEYATTLETLENAEQDENNAFAIFTMEEVEGSVANFIVKPIEMSWQQYQSWTAVDPNKSEKAYYPNGSIFDPAEVGLAGEWTEKTMDLHERTDKSYVPLWGNDNLWIPSVAESGYHQQMPGIWETQETQRKNVSSTEIVNLGVGNSNQNFNEYVNNSTWSRESAYTNLTHVYYIRAYLGRLNNNVEANKSFAVKPALHLNLDLASYSAGVESTITLDFDDESENEAIYQIYRDGFFQNPNAVNKITRVEVKDRAGYQFLGFYTGREGAGTKVIDENGNIVVSSTFFNSNSTIFASWKAEAYVVILNHQNGTANSTIFLRYETAFYSDEACSVEITKISPLPTRVGYEFMGYYIGENGSGTKIIDETGTIVATTSFTTTDTEIFAYWKAKNLAQQNANGKWYVEMGEYPQTKVSDESLISSLDAERTNGNEISKTYTIAGHTLKVYTLDGEEYAYLDLTGCYYKVEPVRYVLQSSSSLKNGFATENGSVTAVSEKIVFASVFQTGWTASDCFGKGYANAQISTNVSEFLSNSLANGEYLNTPTYNVTNFKTATGGKSSTNLSVQAIASNRSEIQSVFGDLSAEFSDLVADILGGYLFYWTRDVGSNLNNAQTISAGGVTGTQMKMSEILGVRVTVNVKTLACS